MFYTDVGNSLLAVDEAHLSACNLSFILSAAAGAKVALIGMPVTGLVVASVALSTAPFPWASENERQVGRWLREVQGVYREFSRRFLVSGGSLAATDGGAQDCGTTWAV